MTFGPDMFVRLGRPIVEGHARMVRTDPRDKEFFFQNWIDEQLGSTYTVEVQGRNTHPDFRISLGGRAEGLEAKSLANRRLGLRDGTPCRTDVDFNSAVPCGRVHLAGEVVRCYYVFMLYEPVEGSDLELDGIALILADGNLLNRDFNLSEAHRNTSEGGFGSYGDGFIRTRKMYRFPNPLTHESLRYRTALVTEDVIEDPGSLGLQHTGTVPKTDTSGTTYEFRVYDIR